MEKVPIDFTYKAQQNCKSVQLAGTSAYLGDWKPINMQKKNDIWSTTIELPVGSYQYKFIVDDNWILDPSRGNNGTNNLVTSEDFVTALLKINASLKLQSISNDYSSPKFQLSLLDLQKRFLSLYTNKQLTDTTIIVNDTFQYDCHRAILASASDYFKNMFASNMMEQSSGKVALQFADFDEKAFEVLLKYFYSGIISDFSPVVALSKFANYLQIPSLQRMLAFHMQENVGESNCIDLLLYFGNQEEYTDLKTKCIEEAALNFPYVTRSESFLLLTFNDLTAVLRHPKLVIAPDSTPFILFKWYESQRQRQQEVNHEEFSPYLQLSVYSFAAKDPLGSVVVCFFADGSERYTPMTIYAIKTFLKNTPKIFAGLLTPSKEVLNEIPARFHHRIVCKQTSSKPHFQDWNPTQYKLDVVLFVSEGFSTIFWMDSDTITIGDLTQPISDFVNSSYMFYFVADHVMFDTEFTKRWVASGLAPCLIPQACFMGFKAPVKDFFKIWHAHWTKWITPKPFAQIKDPHPDFPGSAFCCEQYALGTALLEYTKGKNLLDSIMLFARELAVIHSSKDSNNWIPPAARKVGCAPTNLSYYFSLSLPNLKYYTVQQLLVKKVITSSSMSFASLFLAQANSASLTPIFDKTKDHTNLLVVDFFHQKLIHCYNHNYDNVRTWWKDIKKELKTK